MILCCVEWWNIVDWERVVPGIWNALKRRKRFIVGVFGGRGDSYLERQNGSDQWKVIRISVTRAWRKAGRKSTTRWKWVKSAPIASFSEKDREPIEKGTKARSSSFGFYYPRGTPPISRRTLSSLFLNFLKRRPTFCLASSLCKFLHTFERLRVAVIRFHWHD